MDTEKDEEEKKLFDEAENYFKQNDYFNAIMCLEKAIELNPNEALSYNTLYDTYTNQEQYDNASKQFEDAIEVTPNDFELYKNLGVLYVKQENYDEAIEQYKKAIEINPNYSEAYRKLGLVYEKQGKYVEAVEKYKRSIEINPNYFSAYNNLGCVYIKLENYEEAIKQFKKAISINPDFTAGYNNLGNVYSEQEKYDEAIKQYEKAKKISPNKIIAYNNLGYAYFNLANYDESIIQFQKATEINSNDATAYYNLGCTYSTQEKYDEAIEQYEKAIEIDQKYVAAYKNLGTAYYKQEKYDEAIEQYKIAIEINPNDAITYFYIGNVHFMLAQYNKALEMYKKAIEINPNNGDAYNNLCSVYANKEKYEELLKTVITYCTVLNNGNTTISGILKPLMQFLPNIELDECKDIIFNDDTIFENDKIFESIIDEQSNEYKIFKKVWFYQAYLLEKIAYKESSKDVVHYTSYNMLMHLIGENDEDNKKKTISKVRLNSLSTANDNEEGHTLLHIFRDLNIHVQQNTNNNLVPFQTSFTKNKDSLTMFRLYGKDEHKEATGVCLVFNNDFFTNDTSIDQQPVKLFSPLDGEKNVEKVAKENPKRSLYHILYYNPDDKQLLFNRKKTKHGQNEIINLGDRSETENDEIQECFNRIFEIINSATDKQTCYDLLINLKYLIKSDYWLEETELRLIEIADLNDSDNGIITDKPNNKLYKEYLDVFGSDKKNPYLKAIILGSKIDNAESKAQVIKRWLVEKGYTTIDVSVSKAPLR